MATSTLNYRASLKFTILHRPNGWTLDEVSKLAANTRTYQSRIKPEYLILLEHHSKDELLPIIGDNFTANEVVGLNNAEMPWQPIGF